MPPIFCATKRFSPATSPNWQAFIEWSGLNQLQEVISLDGMLCSIVPSELIPEDWNHNVQADNLVVCFHDLDYLLARVGDLDDLNVLAVVKSPDRSDIEQFSDPRFEFAGLDLIDGDWGISALVNCGGFPRAFANSELCAHGLLLDHARAIEVQQALKREYPASHHAYCDNWAIWQMRRSDSKVET